MRSRNNYRLSPPTPSPRYHIHPLTYTHAHGCLKQDSIAPRKSTHKSILYICIRFAWYSVLFSLSPCSKDHLVGAKTSDDDVDDDDKPKMNRGRCTRCWLLCRAISFVYDTQRLERSIWLDILCLIVPYTYNEPRIPITFWYGGRFGVCWRWIVRDGGAKQVLMFVMLLWLNCDNMFLWSNRNWRWTCVDSLSPNTFVVFRFRV